MAKKRRSDEEAVTAGRPLPKPAQDRDSPSPHEKAWAVARLVLGLLQVMGATVSVYLLIELGVHALSLGSVAVTCLFTTVSVLLFGRKRD